MYLMLWYCVPLQYCFVFYIMCGRQVIISFCCVCVLNYKEMQKHHQKHIIIAWSHISSMKSDYVVYSFSVCPSSQFCLSTQKEIKFHHHKVWIICLSAREGIENLGFLNEQPQVPSSFEVAYFTCVPSLPFSVLSGTKSKRRSTSLYVTYSGLLIHYR